MNNALAGLMNPAQIGADVQNSFRQGIELGTAMRERQQRQSALAGLAANPADAAPVNALMAIDPELALRVRDGQRQESKYQSGQKFDAAARNYFAPNALAPYASPMQGGQGALSPMGQPQAGAMPAVPQPAAQAGQPPQMSARDKAFHEMAAIDPIRAMKIDSDARSQALERLKALDDVYDLAIERLGAAVDEDSYQALLADVGPRFQQFGYDVSTIAPPNYPGPDGIRALLQSSMTAKEQIAALDRRDRAEWDQQDDTMDNARADREASSRIDARRRGPANAERRTQISASRPSGRGGKAPKLTATNPATGETITLNTRGQWVDKNGKPVQ